MKKSYTLTLSILLIIAISVTATLFSGCVSEEKQDTENLFGAEDYAYLVLGTEPVKEYKIALEGLKRDINLVDLLEEANVKHELSYKITEGFLDEVGALKNDPQASTYIFIYTSVEKDFDVSDYAMTVEYKEQTLTSAGVGAAQMTILADCVIYIGTIVW